MALRAAGSCLASVSRAFARTILFSTQALMFGLLVAGLLAPFAPALELSNHFRPFLMAATAVLVLATLAFRFRRWFWAAVVILGVNTGLYLLAAVFSAPHLSAGGSHLRVVTLNTWMAEPEHTSMISFLRGADADLILLQELGLEERSVLISSLARSHQNVSFDENAKNSPAIFSRTLLSHTSITKSSGEEPLALWACMQFAGQEILVASIHAANPFSPAQQSRDVEQLIEELHTRSRPVVLGGDFNLTPYSWKLSSFAWFTSLRWAQTYAASWPGNRLVPLFLLDHVFVSKQFAVLATQIGPNVGSDHRPVVVDLLLKQTRVEQSANCRARPDRRQRTKRLVSLFP